MYKQKYGYVYMTHDIINNKYYIGQHLGDTFDPYYRGSGIKLKEAVKQFGASNFIPTLLNWCYSKEDLDNMEKFWIKTLNASTSDKFYNVSLGGSGGQSFYYGPFRDSHRKHLSEALKGRTSWIKGLTKDDIRVAKCCLSFKGHKHTDEAKAIMSYKHRKENLSADALNRIHISRKKWMSSRGTCFWVNDGQHEYFVSDKEFSDRFLNNCNIRKGRLPNFVYVTKNNVTKKIHESLINQYINSGYTLGKDINCINNIRKSRQHFHWHFNDKVFNTAGQLTEYLHSIGYINIAISTVQNIANGIVVKQYSELSNQIFKERKDK
jgi:group I intron endonuclease